MTAARRGLPYIWVTHLTGILSGEDQCRFAPWLKAHYKIEKQPSDFDSAAWKIQHQEMLNARVAELTQDGWTVTVEDQNTFTLKGTKALLGGKPDIIARRWSVVRIEDTKGGAVLDKHAIQVAIYMIVYHLQHSDVEPEGLVVYKTHVVPVPWTQALAIQAKVFGLIRKIASEDRPPPVPSEAGCRFCDVTAVDCQQRFKADATADVLTSEF